MKLSLSILLLISIKLFYVVLGADRQDLIATPSKSKLDVDDRSVTVDNEDRNTNVFIPSKEWKAIEEGQSIPAGLHVRMNLATGVKEAKLMDSTEPETKSDDQFSHDELKHALKKLKNEAMLQSEDDKTEIKKQFRPMGVLKAEFDKMNMNVETDAEILKRLIDQLKTEHLSHNDTKTVLLEIEYLVHQIDNALNLIELDGFSPVLHILNSTDPELRSLAAFVLGSAMQSNSKVQIAALEKAAIPRLLRMIAIDSSDEVKIKAMYALSCLVRQFPHAQQKMIENGASAIFGKILNENLDESKLRLVKKVITLIFELTQEKELSMNMDQKSDIQKERVKQYSKVKIKESFVNEGFCKVIVQLLPVDDHDTKEIIINSMKTFFDECRNECRSTTKSLERIRQIYKNLSDIEKQNGEDDEYFFVLYKNIDSILLKLDQLEREEL